MGLFSLIGGIIGGNKQAKATKRAADLQFQAAEKGIAENARQFDLTRADFASEQKLGEEGIGGFRRLLGLDGAETQQSEIDVLRASPLYQSLYGNGRDAILANAAATGGLRGGNTQGALYRMGEDTLSSLIRQQLGDYASTIGIGMGSDQAIGNFGANSVAASNQLRNQGAGALAQSQLVRGGIAAQNWSNAGGMLDSALGAALGGGGGGGFNWAKFF
jgi:hypothetical protein